MQCLLPFHVTWDNNIDDNDEDDDVEDDDDDSGGEFIYCKLLNLEQKMT